MYASVYDIKEFYSSRLGRVARRIIQRKIRGLWPDLSGMSLLGMGYSIPYLSEFKQETERCFGLMPANLGVHHWPSGKGEDCLNLTALAEDSELPVETNTIDRILLVHSIEYAELLKPNLQELWRVLKSNGRMIVIIPNRVGLWAGADKTPFGQGTPYTYSQISFYLRDNYFVHEDTDHALFMPPSRLNLIVKSAGLFESVGKTICPAFAGVHMIEASKQVYAGMPSGQETGKAVIRGRKWVLPKPVSRPSVGSVSRPSAKSFSKTHCSDQYQNVL